MTARAMHCWACGYDYDTHSVVTERGPATPKPGDASVCIQCGELAIYAMVLGRLVTRQPTPAEREVMLTNPKIITTLTAWRDAFPRLRAT
jgi:hypothetical protein